MSTTTTPVFVNGLPDRPAGSGQVKQFHRKSRTGCQPCRTRRVKCNEAKPACGGCVRRGMRCIYDRVGKEAEITVKPGKSAAGCNQKPDHADFSDPASAVEGDGLLVDGTLAETRDRRLQELELMHFYITETGPSIAFDSETSHELFVKSIPRMAFKSDALLYSVYAFAALHRAKKAECQDLPVSVPVSLKQHQLYLDLAFRCHEKEMAKFSRDNVDLLLMTTHMMRLVASVVLSERPLVPYTPPLEWMRIANSHAPVFRAAWSLVGDDNSTQIARLFHSTPILWDNNEREGVEKRQNLEHILAWHMEDDPLLWNPDIRRSYESTLSYIGGIWQAVQKRDPPGPIRRRLILFPMFLDKTFIELVAEGRPRSLVVVGHYFALVDILKSFWFVDNTGAREVRAIAAHLPDRWKAMMDLPLRVIEDGFEYSCTPEAGMYASGVANDALDSM